ncbi:MAG: hypothetical protein SFZ24_01905 [Planctomycetota bacterium]|nr:hypothetical protein [Planctomycetota bacterium]
MIDRRDIVDIEGLRRDQPAAPPPPQHAASRPWIGIWFRCCHVYARIMRSPDGSEYRGRCPRCASEVRAVVGPGGTNQRIFEAW